MSFKTNKLANIFVNTHFSFLCKNYMDLINNYTTYKQKKKKN